MEKDFKKWHQEKEVLHKDKERIFFHEREVWWSYLGVNIGFEQDGKGENFERPVVIFKKFNNEIFWAIPLTTKNKKGKYYQKIKLTTIDNLVIKRTVILSQLRLVDAKRLNDKMGVADRVDFLEIKKAISSIVLE